MIQASFYYLGKHIAIQTGDIANLATPNRMFAYLAIVLFLALPANVAIASQCEPVTNPNPDDLTYLSALFPVDPAGSLTTGTANRCIPEVGDPGYVGAGVFPNEYENVNESYYFTVDPLGERNTLSKWRKLHGIDDSRGQRNPDVVSAKYINGFDLGLGRVMYCLKTSKLNANAFPCVVDNYTMGQDPNHPSRPVLFASVAMERIQTTTASGIREYTAFFVFDANGNRINSVDLDGNGEKRVPEACWACHDGGIEADGSHKGQYLSFDTELYKNIPTKPTVEDQQDNFRRLNEIIYAVAEREKSVPIDNDAHKNIQRLIKLWYNGKDPGLALPDDIDFSRTVEISAGHEVRATFYGKYCRTCHVSQTGFYGETNPDDPTAFNCQICHANTAGGDTPPANLKRVLCSTAGAPPIQMPNALIAHNRLADDNLNIDRTITTGSLLSSLQGGTDYTPCAAEESIFVPPPRNDPWENAIELTRGTIGGTLVAATPDIGSSSSVGSPGKPEVWYKFTAPRRGIYRFNTCGSNDGGLNAIDTVLSIHSAGPGSETNELAANDDRDRFAFDQQACQETGTSTFDSALRIKLTAKQKILIRVSIFNDTAVGGNFQLQLAPKNPICLPIDDKHGNATMICF